MPPAMQPSVFAGATANAVAAAGVGGPPSNGGRTSQAGTSLTLPSHSGALSLGGSTTTFGMRHRSLHSRTASNQDFANAVLDGPPGGTAAAMSVPAAGCAPGANGAASRLSFNTSGALPAAAAANIMTKAEGKQA